MFSGWRSKSRLIMVESSKLKSMDWCNAQLNRSRRVVWCFYENSVFSSPRQSQGNQLEDGCKDKIWDPRLSYDSQFWELTSWGGPHQSLMKKVGTSDNRLKNKHSWRFKDGYKHKPP
ncbi:hypothetical protein AHAS_Ahas19G0239800 [Arachis hypogaea]